jgi:hypothetical protein
MADLEWNGNAPGIGREKFYQQSVVGRQSSVVSQEDVSANARGLDSRVAMLSKQTIRRREWKL